ncbi:hypothetical protein CL689_02220 [Candidatus Saccharibacteria bacterium]|nr:hypothetical protein [Candidatus Saccharibacteria bacterium]|tara:strand:- start:2599 stop:3120 length:522 start_codon:yes stop_codon:yes gene_type:complete
MPSAERSIAITISAQESAKRIAKEYNLQSSRVLNSLSQCAGFDDFGALKANQPPAKKKTEGTYAIVRFTCINGGFESNHILALASKKPNDLEDLEKKATELVLCFYDNFQDLEIEDEEKQGETKLLSAYEKRRKELEEDGAFWCAGGEILTTKVFFREVTKEQYDAVNITKSL